MTVALGISLAFGQSLTVSSPNNGDVLGRSNTIRFLISNINSQVRVIATATKDDDSSVRFSSEGLFDPDADQRVFSSLDLNFDEATPAGSYTLVVQVLRQGNQIQTRTVSNLRVDTKNPKFLRVTPINNSFASFSVLIQALLEEGNIDRWRVRVNDRDIPNNTGSTNDISVLWTTTSQENDGQVSIGIRAEDQARNVANRSINVTIDRVSPTISISSPTTVSYRPRSIIPVIVDVQDQFQGSVVNAGVSVSLRTMDGRFIAKVARRATRNQDRVFQWVGRIRNTERLPRQFKVVVTAVDRAGNPAQTQEVIVSIGG